MTFEDFWAIYPRKICRKPALKAWNSAIKREKPEVIISAARKYAAERAGKQIEYTCHATTWLNQDRWEDYRSSQQPAVNQQSVDELNATWVIKHGYAAWIPDAWVRRAIAIGLLQRDIAQRAGYPV